jgi:hypothetical protein
MLNSIRELAIGRQLTFKMNYHSVGAKWETYGCSALSLIYLLLPYFFLPFGQALALATLTNVLSSLFFALQFVVNHEVSSILHCFISLDASFTSFIIFINRVVCVNNRLIPSSMISHMRHPSILVNSN